MTGSDLVLSGTRADFGPTGGPSSPCSSRTTARASSRRSRRTRRSEARRSGPSRQAGHQSQNNPLRAAFRNRARRPAPVDAVHAISPAEPDGIPGPNAEIDLGAGGTIGEAKDLALVLQTGALPVSFQQIERTDVSATLGKSSLKQAWHAALIGLLIVALFLLVL